MKFARLTCKQTSDTIGFSLSKGVNERSIRTAESRQGLPSGRTCKRDIETSKVPSEFVLNEEIIKEKPDFSILRSVYKLGMTKACLQNSCVE